MYCTSMRTHIEEHENEDQRAEAFTTSFTTSMRTHIEEYRKHIEEYEDTHRGA